MQGHSEEWIYVPNVKLILYIYKKIMWLFKCVLSAASIIQKNSGTLGRYLLLKIILTESHSLQNVELRNRYLSFKFVCEHRWDSVAEAKLLQEHECDWPRSLEQNSSVICSYALGLFLFCFVSLWYIPKSHHRLTHQLYKTNLQNKTYFILKLDFLPPPQKKNLHKVFCDFLNIAAAFLSGNRLHCSC